MKKIKSILLGLLILFTFTIKDTSYIHEQKSKLVLISGAKGLCSWDTYIKNDNRFNEYNIYSIKYEQIRNESIEYIANYILLIFSVNFTNSNLNILASSLGGILIQYIITYNYSYLQNNNIIIEHIITFGTPYNSAWCFCYDYWFNLTNNIFSKQLAYNHSFLINLQNNFNNHEISWFSYRGTINTFDSYCILIYKNHLISNILFMQIYYKIGCYWDNLITNKSPIISFGINRFFNNTNHSQISCSTYEIRTYVLQDLLS